MPSEREQTPGGVHGTEPASGTRVIKRMAALMRLLAAHNRAGMKLMDLCRGAGIERSTAHRLLQSLVEEGLIVQDRLSKRYFLGMAVYEMGVAVPAMQLRDLCHPHLRQMAVQTGDTNFLTVRSGFDGVCLDRNEGANPISYVLEAGRRRPLGVGSSNLAILSNLDADEVGRICRENLPRLLQKFPRYSEAELLRRLALARRHGYVLADVVEKFGIRALAMCIRDHDGKPIAAVSISALGSELEGERMTRMKLLLRSTIDAIEVQLHAAPIAMSAF